MNKSILVTFFLINFAGLYSQQFYYESGYVITNNGDTLKGRIERFSESKISLKINFIQDPDNQKTESYSPNEISGFCFLNDSLCFRRVEYVTYTEGNKITQFRFAKILVDGDIGLYKLQLPEEEQNIIFEKNNTYVYIIRKDNNDYVLKQIEKFISSTNMYRYDKKHQNLYRLEKTYIHGLKYLFSDCQEFNMNKIETAKFNDDEFISLVHKYSVCKGYKVKLRKHEVKPQFYNSIYAAYNFVLKSRIPNQWGYTAGYSFCYKKPDLNENISFIIGVEYFHINRPLQLYHPKFNSSFETSDRKDFIRFPLYTNIVFLKRNIKPTISAGVAGVFGKKYLHMDVLYGVGIEYKKLNISLNFSCEDILPYAPVTSMVTLNYWFNRK